MSSLKQLASAVVNGDAKAVNVWSRPCGEIVVVGEGPDDTCDRWSGSVGEWKRALTASILDDSRNRLDQQIKSRLDATTNVSDRVVNELTAEAETLQESAKVALAELQQATGKLF